MSRPEGRQSWSKADDSPGCISDTILASKQPSTLLHCLNLHIVSIRQARIIIFNSSKLFSHSQSTICHLSPEMASSQTASEPRPDSLLTSPIAVPTHGPGGSFSVLTRCIVRASPESLLNAVRDVSTWPEWNTFCPEGKISDSAKESKEGVESGQSEWDHPVWLNPGSHCDLLVCMSGDKTGSTRRQVVEVTGIWKLEACDELPVPEDRFSPELSSASIFPVPSSENQEGTAKRVRKGYRIAWASSGWSHWQLHSERVMEFEELPGEGEAEVRTVYTCWETFGGLLGGTVKFTVGNTLVARFGDYSRDLKGYVEKSNDTSRDGA